jgi:hypothetical protein
VREPSLRFIAGQVYLFDLGIKRYLVEGWYNRAVGKGDFTV